MHTNGNVSSFLTFFYFTKPFMTNHPNFDNFFFCLIFAFSVLIALTKIISIKFN